MTLMGRRWRQNVPPEPVNAWYGVLGGQSSVTIAAVCVLSREVSCDVRRWGVARG